MTTRGETYDKLVELQHLMGAAHTRLTEEQGPMADATRGRGRVLALLKLRDGVATKDMAEVLGIRVSSLNEVLGRLEAEGYVERRASETDRRIMLVYLTDKGKAAEVGQHRLADVALRDLTDAEVDTLDDYVDRMSAALEAELGEAWHERKEHIRRHRERMFAGHAPAGGPHGPRGHHGGHFGGGAQGCVHGHGHGGRGGWGHGGQGPAGRDAATGEA